MDRILLSTFVLKVKNNTNNYTILDRFNETDDFITVVENYLTNIFQNIKSTTSAQDSTNLNITLDSMPIVDIPNRRIYGYFSSGVGNDKYLIRDLSTRVDVLNVDRNHGAFRNLFFLIKIPRHMESGGVILQRKSKYGIKILFQQTINNFIREQGYQGYRIEVNNIIHGKVYRRMIEEGKLKKLSFIKNKIPGSIEEYYKNNGKPQETKGKLIMSMASANLPDNYKQFVDNLFTNPNSDRIEITGSEEKFDELEFELELKGKKKTFYVINRSRIQPDVDVTADVDIIDEDPTTESLVRIAEELYSDIIDMSPKV